MKNGTSPNETHKEFPVAYKNTRRQFLFVRFAFLPLMVPIVLLVRSQFEGSIVYGISFALLAVWVLLLVQLYMKLRRWPCPKCQQAIGSVGGISSTLMEPLKCAHCGTAIDPNENLPG